MHKSEILEILRLDIDNSRKYTVDEIGEYLRHFSPVFGELKIEIEEKEVTRNSKAIKTVRYIDEDIVTIVTNSKTNEIKELENPIDMSSLMMEIDIDKDNTIICVDNNINGFITKANKDLVLFSALLIGKKIENL